MVSFLGLIRDLLTQDQGQNLIEYAVIAMLIGLVAMAEVHKFGNSMKKEYNTLGNDFSKAVKKA